ncbi:YgdI/YgdR family lipoprotein [Frigoriglobus tundricola]|uniref:hypothetical protein n=1 Tax=Frigoriglobus tundricola TaxID=2774151 RepID=UPI00148EBFEF|nr:hypothetical protein [Frigoriglobus tundricola]
MLIELVRSGLDVSAAAWVKTSEEGLWFLYIGSPSVTAGNLADAYRSVYACLRHIPNSSIEMSEVKLVHASNPIVRELAAIRDRYPGVRLGTRFGGKRLGSVAVEDVYVYPRIMPGMTRDEVIHTVTGLMNRTGVARPSVVSLRDGSVIRGVPYGLEVNRQTGQQTVLVIKIQDDADGSTRTVPADEVSNIQ